MTEDIQPHPSATRRGVLLGVGAIGMGAFIAACTANHPPSVANSPVSGSEPTEDPSTTTAAPAGPLKASDVPVGGGTVIETRDTVVTQPQVGRFEAFSATCTHQGCTVSDVSGGTINCPCHGSQYDIADGSVITGPATRSLAKKTVMVRNGILTIG